MLESISTDSMEVGYIFRVIQNLSISNLTVFRHDSHDSHDNTDTVGVLMCHDRLKRTMTAMTGFKLAS